eukprot:CAMPEP_0115085840 /NCGR_PEP_ID=MMETSP0227-20121206/22198_1 /TAXON_ID=89957 /ORGANISM="Polarella glacialis, Strain CCMP 1383" /LENGTH=816 /DNA_ID=CAMNT_0002475121 /DNA_START=158 /DNA_END=2608 /DNA_ORIENTATION=+
MGDRSSDKSRRNGAPNPAAQDAKSQKRWRQGAKRDTFPWINSQIITVSETGQLHKLIATIEAFLPQMNLVNISTAFHRLAKATSKDVSPQVMGQQPVIQGLLEAAKATLAKSSASGTQPSAQALSNISWAMATLHLVDDHLLQAMAIPASSQVPSFKPFELSTILWSYAKLSTLNADACYCAQHLFELASIRIPHTVEAFTFRCLVTTVWAYATFRFARSASCLALFNSLSGQMMTMAHTANCVELANTAWAYGTMGTRNERLLQEIAKRANARLHEFKAQELSALLWGFSAAGFYNGAVFSAAAVTLQRLDMTPQHLVNSLWALTRKKPRQLAMHALTLVPACTMMIERFSTVEIVAIASASAKAVRFCDGKGGGRRPSMASDFCAAANSQVLHRLKDLTPSVLVGLAAAFLVVRYSGAVVMLAAVGREALDRLQVLETSLLLALIRLFVVDLSCLQPPALLEGACQGMARAVFAEAARRLGALRPREMQVLVKLCAEALGLPETAEDMSASDLRSCCFALATTGVVTLARFDSLDELLEDESDLTWCPDPITPVTPQQHFHDLGSRAAGGFDPGFGPNQAYAPPYSPAWAGGDGGYPQARPGSTGQRLPQLVMMNTLSQAWAMPCMQQSPGCSSSMAPPYPVNFRMPHHQEQPPSHPGQHHMQYPHHGDHHGVNHGQERSIGEKFSESSPSGLLPTANRLACSVKNTFLHVDCEEDEKEDEEGVPWMSEETLGPPLQFLPKDIELSELQAFRQDYMKFRAGKASGARGEIGDIPEVSCIPPTLDALGLSESREGQMRQLLELGSPIWPDAPGMR